MLTPAQSEQDPVRDPPISAETPGLPAFDAPDLAAALELLDPRELDRLGFGLVSMHRDGTVTGYNRFESERAGLEPERVLSRNFFIGVGPCTNNPMIAGRFVTSHHRDEDLDEEIDYVFSFRLKTTPVRLRMMARAGSEQQFLAVLPR